MFETCESGTVTAGLTAAGVATKHSPLGDTVQESVAAGFAAFLETEQGRRVLQQALRDIHGDKQA